MPRPRPSANRPPGAVTPSAATVSLRYAASAAGRAFSLGAKLGATLSTNGGAWPQPFAVTVQWLRNGEPIAGATDNTYELTAEDVGKQISVRHVADRPTHVQEEGRGAPVDFTDVTRTAPAVVPAPGDALTALTPAAIAGSGKVGSTLTATAPEWSSNGVTDARQWFRGETAIDGATGDWSMSGDAMRWSPELAERAREHLEVADRHGCGQRPAREPGMRRREHASAL